MRVSQSRASARGGKEDRGEDDADAPVMYPRTIASTLMTSHFLTTIDRPLSWSAYCLTASGKLSQSASAAASERGRTRWDGMIEASLSNQKRESDVRSLPLSVMDCPGGREKEEQVSEASESCREALFEAGVRSQGRARCPS